MRKYLLLALILPLLLGGCTQETELPVVIEDDGGEVALEEKTVENTDTKVEEAPQEKASVTKTTPPAKKSISDKPVIPVGCSRWFDGCNTCTVLDGKLDKCTLRACQPQDLEEPKCTAYDYVEKSENTCFGYNFTDCPSECVVGPSCPGCDDLVCQKKGYDKDWKKICSDYNYDNCPSECVVGPSCPMCADIGCHKKGYNSTWGEPYNY